MRVGGYHVKPEPALARPCYHPGMDGPLLIATTSLAGVVILATVGLATLIVNVGRGIRRDLTARMNETDSRLTARMDDLAAGQGEMRERMDGLAASQGEIRERMARLEGLLEGLREAVSGRRAA